MSMVIYILHADAMLVSMAHGALDASISIEF